MDEREKTYDLAYRAHIQRLMQVCPEHASLFRAVFLEQRFVQAAVGLLAQKSLLTENDGEYHNALLGFPTQLECPSFCVIEFAAAPSVGSVGHYWKRLEYDSYEDYVHGILYGEGKGLKLFAMKTGKVVPEELTKQFLAQFLYGHFVRAVAEQVLLTSLVWLAPDDEAQLLVFPPELL